MFFLDFVKICNNPKAFEIQEKKDAYDLMQLKKKKKQSEINQMNAGFGGFKKTEEDHPGILLRILAGILTTMFIIQIILNFMRIGSQ